MKQIMESIDILYRFIVLNPVQFFYGVDLVLDLRFLADGTFSIGYYFADHKTRLIFFVHEYYASNLQVWGQIRGVTCHSHLRKFSPLVKTEIHVHL